jgi:DNA polymerase-3 subunit delta'
VTTERLPWHAELWRRLAERLQAGRFPHALLVTGLEGLGKRQLVAALSETLLCQSRSPEGVPCGDCRACRLIPQQAHPDLLWIEPEGTSRQIKVDQIRALNEFLALKSQYGGHRVAVLSPADQMNLAAANSLLKTLEEPSAGAVLLLTASRPAQLPATIRSRCQQLAIAPPPVEEATRWLEQQGAADAAALLELASGAPLRALALAQAGTAGRFNELLNVLEAVKQGRRDPVSVAQACLQPGARAIVPLWASLLYDLVRVASGGAPRYGEPGRLHALIKGLDLLQLHGFLDRLSEARRQLDHPLNEQLLLEDLLVGWQRLTQRPASAPGR